MRRAPCGSLQIPGSDGPAGAGAAAEQGASAPRLAFFASILLSNRLRFTSSKHLLNCDAPFPLFGLQLSARNFNNWKWCCRHFADLPALPATRGHGLLAAAPPPPTAAAACKALGLS